MKKSILAGIIAGLFVVAAIGIYAWLGDSATGAVSGSASKSDPVIGNAGPSDLKNRPDVTPPGSAAAGTAPGANTGAQTGLTGGAAAQAPGMNGAALQGTASQGMAAQATAPSFGTQALPALDAKASNSLAVPTLRSPEVQSLTPLAIGKPGSTSLEQIQQRLQQLTANGRQPSAAEVDAVLADLQKNQGKNAVAGVDLQGLRDTLARTDRIQQIGLELQAIAANPSKIDQARLQSLTAEMQRLQTALLAGLPRTPAR
jgi:hypothetical protein